MKINRDTLFSAIVYIPHLPSTITINKSKNVQETLARFSELYTWHKALRYEIVYHKSLTGTCTNMTITVRRTGDSSAYIISITSTATFPTPNLTITTLLKKVALKNNKSLTDK